ECARDALIARVDHIETHQVKLAFKPNLTAVVIAFPDQLTAGTLLDFQVLALLCREGQGLGAVEHSVLRGEQQLASRKPALLCVPGFGYIFTFVLSHVGLCSDHLDRNSLRYSLTAANDTVRSQKYNFAAFVSSVSAAK